jgi:hypothetical protein
MRAVLAVVVLLAACGQTEAPTPAAEAPAAAPAAPAAPAPAGLKGDVYGGGVSLTESTPVSKLLAEADQYDGKVVRVEGTVTEVCEKRGCWMNIASDAQFEALRFKVQDGVITIPLEAKGRYAVAEGTLRKVALSPEDAQAMRDHEAEEQGKPVDNTIPLPTYSIKLEGTGAVIRDAM